MNDDEYFKDFVRSSIEEMQLKIAGLEIKCDLLRDQQARTLQRIEEIEVNVTNGYEQHKVQSVLNGKLVDNIENHSKELNLLIQRIVTLWETVMKPTQA